MPKPAGLVPAGGIARSYFSRHQVPVQGTDILSGGNSSSVGREVMQT